MRTYWRKASPKPSTTGVVTRREDTESQTQREGDHAMTEADWSEASPGQGWLVAAEAERKAGNTLLQSLQGDHGPAYKLTLGSSLQLCERIRVCCFECPVCS